MRCKKVCFYYYLFGAFFLNLVLAAPHDSRHKKPSSSHGTSGMKYFMQAEEPIPKPEDDSNASEVWYGTLDLKPRNETKEDYQDEDSKKKNISHHQKPPCADSNCTSSSSKKSSNATEESLDQLLMKITNVLSSESKVLEKDVAELRRLISKVSEKTRQLQSSKSSSGCAGTKKLLPVAEVEERHTVERKVIHAKEHHDRNRNKDDLALKPVAESEPYQVTPVMAAPLTVANYIEAVTPDVNYNGGIQRPMDDLKRDYPPGFWPDHLLDSDYDDDQDEKDYEIVDMEENIDPSKGGVQPTTGNILSEEYLENIIRSERNHNQIASERKHHVGEHKLSFE